VALVAVLMEALQEVWSRLEKQERVRVRGTARVRVQVKPVSLCPRVIQLGRCLPEV